MIVYKENKGFETRSDKPNENWTNKDCFVVEDGTELAQKIINAYPHYDFITDTDGNLIDIEVLEKPIVTPEPTTEDYLIDLDFRLSMIELGI
jgi:hypothetical protein